MLHHKVRSLLETNNVMSATRTLSIGRLPIDVRPVILKAAVDDIVRAFRFVVTQYGLPNMSSPRPAPLSNDFVMRALVMLRAIYQYEVRTPKADAVLVKGGQYDGVAYRAPGREELCGKNGGLIVENYRAMQIDTIGYEPSCGGTVGVGQAAHLLAEAGLIFERYETQIEEFTYDGHVDEDIAATYKKAKTPYALTDVGRIFCFWLFGDHVAVARSNGINNNGYSGIKSVIQSKGGNYSGWLNFLELDFPTSENSDNISSSQGATDHHNTKVDVSNDEDDEDGTVAALSSEEIADDIKDTLLKLGDSYSVVVEDEE